MYAAPSESSQVSHLSQQILDNVSKKSETKLFKMEANVNHAMINSAWASFGAVLAKNLRLGKAIVIPKFGTITFTSPNVKLEVKKTLFGSCFLIPSGCYQPRPKRCQTETSSVSGFKGICVRNVT